MAFDQSTITDLSVSRAGRDLVIAWTTTSPAGTWWQVYLGRKLAAVTRRNVVHVPYPTQTFKVDVGAVLAIERNSDLSGSLPSAPADRASLSWLGGTYLDATGNDDVGGFRVYGSDTAGGAIDYATVLADIPAYPGGVISDGFGVGGFGQGGFGRAASSYSWISDVLTSGVWSFGIVPYDLHGNAQGSPLTTSVTITAPPATPGAFSDGTRLRYTFNPAGFGLGGFGGGGFGTGEATVTLTWNP